MPGDHRGRRAEAPHWRTDVVAALAIAAVVSGGLGLLLAAGGDPTKLLPDATTAAEVPPYYGIVATLGVMTLSAVVGACLIAAWTLRGSERPGGAFALFSGLLLGAFVLDDALLLHEAAAPELGIPETAVLALHAIAWLIWAWTFRVRLIGRPLLPAIAVVASALSVVVDQITEEAIALEDGAKLIGLLTLSWFVLQSAHADLMTQASSSSTTLVM